MILHASQRFELHTFSSFREIKTNIVKALSTPPPPPPNYPSSPINPPESTVAESINPLSNKHTFLQLSSTKQNIECLRFFIDVMCCHSTWPIFATGISPRQKFFKMAEQKNAVFDQNLWKISHRKFTSHFKMGVIEYAKKENITVSARKYKFKHVFIY